MLPDRKKSENPFKDVIQPLVHNSSSRDVLQNVLY